MAPRRRFFPSTKVQTVPGRTVELEMQLRRSPVSKPVSHNGTGDGADDLIGVGWFTPIFNGWTEWIWEEQPDGRWNVYGDGASSLWDGTGDGSGAPSPSATFRCVELLARADWAEGPRTQHVGVLQGATMSNVRWEASWDAPSPSDPSVSGGIGNRFSTWGNVILVEQINTGGSGGPDGSEWTETLNATAFSGGLAVGTLVLHCFHPAY